MPLKTSVFIATSLDGFIARPDGRIDWLEAANRSIPPGEDCGFKAFFNGVDVLVMGRHTFEQVRTFPVWLYGSKPVVVLSGRGVEIPPELRGTVSCLAGEPAELHRQLQSRGYTHAYVDGGVTVQRFMAAGLLDELTVTLIPVLLGQGLPLFGPLPGDVSLELRECRCYPFGFTQLKYGVVRT